MKESRSAKKPTAAAHTAEPAVPAATELELPADGGIRLELPGFEGPLDLLLHLIQEHELDILNIPVAFITKKYLEYIGLMQELNIDIASEYLVMAATLAHIKSRMLLPTPPADLEEGEEEELDPRAELIRRLLEYQKYKKAGEELAARSVLGRDVFVRGALPAADPTTAPLAPVSSFKLLEAFQRILARAKIVVDHQIEFERFSLSDRINQLVDLLKNKGRVGFEALFDGQRTRADLIVTFLALLELTRLRMTRLFQDGSLEPIFIELSVTDDEDAAMARADAGIDLSALTAAPISESASVTGQESTTSPDATESPSADGGDAASATAADATVQSTADAGDEALLLDPSPAEGGTAEGGTGIAVRDDWKGTEPEEQPMDAADFKGQFDSEVDSGVASEFQQEDLRDGLPIAEESRRDVEPPVADAFVEAEWVKPETAQFEPTDKRNALVDSALNDRVQDASDVSEPTAVESPVAPPTHSPMANNPSAHSFAHDAVMPPAEGEFEAFPPHSDCALPEASREISDGFDDTYTPTQRPEAPSVPPDVDVLSIDNEDVNELASDVDPSVEALDADVPRSDAEPELK